MRRLLCIVCPWYVLWRVRQLAESPFIYGIGGEEWDRGYEQAMWEILLNLGRDPQKGGGE